VACKSGKWVWQFGCDTIQRAPRGGGGRWNTTLPRMLKYAKGGGCDIHFNRWIIHVRSTIEISCASLWVPLVIGRLLVKEFWFRAAGSDRQFH